jgi:DNA-directed RNA polymerase subunit H (RpoH/RPB5)
MFGLLAHQIELNKLKATAPTLTEWEDAENYLIFNRLPKQLEQISESLFDGLPMTKKDVDQVAAEKEANKKAEQKAAREEKVKADKIAAEKHKEWESKQTKMNLEEKTDILARYNVEGYNKPKRTPSHKTKSHLVVAKKGDKVKVIRFGAQGAKGSPKKEGESESYKKRRQGFVARHKAQNPGGLKDKMSALYWANKVKW